MMKGDDDCGEWQKMCRLEADWRFSILFQRSNFGPDSPPQTERCPTTSMLSAIHLQLCGLRKGVQYQSLLSIHCGFIRFEPVFATQNLLRARLERGWNKGSNESDWWHIHHGSLSNEDRFKRIPFLMIKLSQLRQASSRSPMVGFLPL